MSPFPAASGGVLAGQIQVPASLRPQFGYYLRLSCVRRSTTGPVNNLKTTEKVLWQGEKWLRADLPPAGANLTHIPVYFQLPGELPESSVSPGAGPHWKLEASAKLRGPEFQAAFDVPVFQLPDAPMAPEDSAAAYQLSLDELRQQTRSPIQVRELASGGKEFIFPSVRNPGFASGATGMCLIWTGVIVLLLWKHAPPPFLLGLSAIDVFMVAFVLDLWLRQCRVTVNARGLTAQRQWLAFKQERRFAAGDIKRIASDAGATVGFAAYRDLKVFTRDGKEFVLAKNLNNPPEADWLVRQMTQALRANDEAPVANP
jgi:hypothetical protein